MAEEIIFNAHVSSIVNFEKKTGVSVLNAFGEQMSMTNIFELVKCCSNATDKMIDEYVKANGFDKLASKLVDALVDSGFLPKPTGKKTN